MKKKDNDKIKKSVQTSSACGKNMKKKNLKTTPCIDTRTASVSKTGPETMLNL